MNNPLWKMMITNAQEYLKSIPETERDSGKHLDVFTISQVLAVCTAKVPADIVVEIGGFTMDEIYKDANKKFGSTMKKLKDK